MKILVIGSGGREHALCTKVANSQRVRTIYCAPGNGGTAEVAENVDINPDEMEKLVAFAKEKEIDLTIVGPEMPLVEGIVDLFNENELRIFGVNKDCARLEGSKEFSKDFMKEYGIPTAKYKVLTELKQAVEVLKEFEYPLVIKASGLCAGKGVIICRTEEEALKTLDDIFKLKVFGDAGESIIIEEFLIGTEASLLCFVTEGKILPLESAVDYQKIFDNDQGPNTGGVGCISPSPCFDKDLNRKIEREILHNLRFGFENEGMNYRGVLFIGLMIVDGQPKVLEFNTRFGDPETQALMPRLDADIIELLQKTIDGTINETDLVWNEQCSVTVVATSKGYPNDYETGFKIEGIDKLDRDIILIHSGTKKVDEELLTNGGRVLSLTSLADNIEEAKEKVYSNMDKINFEGMHYRKDIGKLL